MSHIEFRLVGLKDGKEVLSEPLSFEFLSTLVSCYPDAKNRPRGTDGA